MPNNTCCKHRRRCERRRPAQATVVTNRADCCNPPEILAEELYAGVQPAILINDCYDGGCQTHYDSRRRCGYWPSFAHPRWLTCGQLYDVRL